MQNIGGENAGDAFYRYKMPKLAAKIEGRGNGIKTNVVNNADIAKALERPPEYVLKYFGCELGAQINYDAKTGNSIVNGAHDTKKLCELLEGFIKRYVQCYECGNPETQIKIRKDFIYLNCRACGSISNVDMRHKLNTFILKNPPENKMSKEEKKLKKAEEERLRLAKEQEREHKEKKDKKREKRKKKKKNEEDGEDGEEGDDDKATQDGGEQPQADEEDDAESDKVVWMTDTSAEAQQRRAKEQLSAATAAMVMSGGGGGGDGAEAAAANGSGKDRDKSSRKKGDKDRDKGRDKAALAKQGSGGVAASDGEGAGLGDMVRRAASMELTDKQDIATAAKVLTQLLQQGKPGSELAPMVHRMTVEGGLPGKLRALLEALMGLDAGGGKVSEVVASRQEVLKACVADETAQLSLVIALESYLGVVAAGRVKEAALAFKELYDRDIVEEHVFEAWDGREDAGKVLGVPPEAGRAVRKAAEPFVKWLAEAEDDEEEDEDEDEEE